MNGDPAYSDAMRKNHAFACLIAGLTALAISPVPVFSLGAPVAGILALVFGMLSLRRGRSAMAMVGIVAGSLGLAIVVAIGVWLSIPRS
jgi:hypothetical protein